MSVQQDMARMLGAALVEAPYQVRLVVLGPRPLGRILEVCKLLGCAAELVDEAGLVVGMVDEQGECTRPGRDA